MRLDLEQFVVKVKLQQLIQQEMVRSGMTQARLARKMKMSRQAVNQHLTSGPSSVKVLVEMLYHLGCRLQVSVDYYERKVG